MNRGKRSLIVARPITLILDDKSTALDETFHLAGPGTDFMNWNNTGVYKNFACSAGPVSVPNGVEAIAENGLWKVYQLPDSLLVGVHSTTDIGILSVFDQQNPGDLVNKLSVFNADPEKVKTQFHFLDGYTIDYDVNATKDRWVIKAIDGKPLDRNYDNWGLLEIE